jgi:acetate kinase
VRVLVVNAGSSSLKLRLLEEHGRVTFSRGLSVTSGGFDDHALVEDLRGMGPVDATGHRIVHGGTLFDRATLVDHEVRQQLGSLVPLAPQHQPRSLAALDIVTRTLIGTPSIACFDTAFHYSLPPAAATYAVPAGWRNRYSVRRYGFHGLSHGYAGRRAGEILQHPAAQLRMVTCHLGAGASLAAVHGGRSVDTTMGFTPLEGLVMATRSGTVDPGLVLWLQQSGKLSLEDVADALEHHSGLKALAGTADMRKVLAAAEIGDPNARLALDIYVHRLCASIAGMAAAMGGIDVLVFTGGVGENASLIRQEAAARMGFLGVRVDGERNLMATGDADIGSRDAAVRTLVVTSREDVEIEREVRQVLEDRASG